MHDGLPAIPSAKHHVYNVQMKILAGSLALLALTTTLSLAQDPRPTIMDEPKVRQMLGLPADAKLRYLADDGSETTFHFFSLKQRVASTLSAKIPVQRLFGTLEQP